LLEIPRPVVDFVKIKDSYCDDNDGQATAIVTSGVLPYEFEWIEGTPGTIFSTDSVVVGLSEGLYSLIVRDANACDTQINFSILNIASPNAAIQPVSPQTIFEGQTVDLIGTADVPNPLFTWRPSEWLSCGHCDTLIAQPLQTITYELLIVDSVTRCRDSTLIT